MTNGGCQQQYTRFYHPKQRRNAHSPLLRAECAHAMLVARSGCVALDSPVVVVHTVVQACLGQLLPQ